MASTTARSYALWTVVILCHGLLALTFFLLVVAPPDLFLGSPHAAAVPKSTDGLFLKLNGANSLFNVNGEAIPDLDRWLQAHHDQGRGVENGDKNSRVQILAERNATYGDLRDVVETLRKHGIVTLRVRIENAVLDVDPPPEESGTALPPIGVKLLTDQSGLVDGLLCGDTPCKSLPDLHEKMREIVGEDTALGNQAPEARAELYLPRNVRLFDLAIVYLVIKDELPAERPPRPLVRHVDLFPPENQLDGTILDNVNVRDFRLP